MGHSRPVDGAVDKAVDKHHFLGRTARVLWMNCGWLKNLGIRGRTPLCGPRQRRRNALTAGDGDRPGGDLGDAGRAGKPAIDAGIRDRQQVSRARRPSNRCAGAAAGRGPSISYMEGPSVCSGRSLFGLCLFRAQPVRGVAPLMQQPVPSPEGRDGLLLCLLADCRKLRRPSLLTACQLLTQVAENALPP